MAIDFELWVWCVPLVVGGLGAWRPRYGLAAFAAALPLFGVPPGGPYLAALDAAALVAVLVSLRAVHKRFPGEADWRHSGLEWPVAAWVVVSVASLVPLAYWPPSLSPRALSGLIQALPGVESGMLLYTWRALTNLLLGVGLFWAIRRAFGGRSIRPLGLGLAAGVGLTVGLGLLELLGLVDLWGYRPIGDPLYDTRLHSLFFHSGWWAEYLVLAVPFAVAALGAGARWGRLAAGALLVGSLACIVFTQQRGAWIAVLCQLAVLSLAAGGSWSPAMKRTAATALVGVVVACGAIGWLRPDLVGPVLQRGERIVSDLSGRSYLWRDAVALGMERPLLGWGLGGFPTAYDAIGGAWRFHGTAHSLYLNTLAERGAVGVLALLVVGWAAWSGLRQAKASGRGERGDMALALLVSGTGLAVYGLVQYIFYLKNLEFVSWLLLGAASVLMAGTAPGLTRRFAQVVLGLAIVLVPWRLVALEPLVSPSSRAYGLHEVELGDDGREHRWIEGRAAWRVPRADVVRLEIVDGHPLSGLREVAVSIRADGREVWSGPAPGQWTVVEIPLEPSPEEWVVLEISSRPTFRPFSDFEGYEDLGRSRDIRELALAVREATP